MSKKFEINLKDDIERKVREHEYSDDEKVIRNKLNGQIVCFRKLEEKDRPSDLLIANKYIQVINNYITITDTNEILSGILEIESQKIFDDLVLMHKKCVAYRNQYVSAKNENIIETLNKSSLDALVTYEHRVCTLMENDFNDGRYIKDLDRIIGAFLEIALMFKYSSIKYNKSLDADYQQVYDSLSTAYYSILPVYEKLLMRNENRKSDSLYYEMLLDMDFEKISRYLAFDSRFENKNIFDFIRDNLKIKTWQEYGYHKPFNYELSASIEKYTEDEKETIECLYKILNDLSDFLEFNHCFKPSRKLFSEMEPDRLTLLIDGWH